MHKLYKKGTNRHAVNYFLGLVVATCCFMTGAAAQCGSFPAMKQQRKTISIPGGYFTGILEWLPADYNANPSKKYPVIIYLPGNGAVGNGSPSALCSIITDQGSSLPVKIEQGLITNSYTYGEETFSYIFISAQYSGYGETNYHHPDDMDALIDYVIANYQVDVNRIYLTGMSAGANLIIDYVGNSVEQASRVAAIGVASLCFNLSYNPQGPANIAAAGLPAWFTHCTADNPCVVSIPDAWVDQINSNGADPAPIYTRLEPPPSGVGTTDYCHWSFFHDTWRTLYDPGFTVGGLNFFEWNLQYQLPTSLPITLKSQTVRLSNGKVYLRWITATESNNASFSIERAGGDQQFTPLATIPGHGTSSSEKIYEFVDEKPLPNMSYYRLVQTDLDGRQQRFPIQRILNRSGVSGQLVVSSNPFVSDLSAFIKVNRAQQVVVSLTDMSGKRLLELNRQYAVGMSEINLPASRLPAGIYLLKAVGTDFSVIRKVVKK